MGQSREVYFSKLTRIMRWCRLTFQVFLIIAESHCMDTVSLLEIAEAAMLMTSNTTVDFGINFKASTVAWPARTSKHFML